MAPTIENNYVGDGSTVLYSFTFPYISEEDVFVEVDGTLTTEYTFANVTTIEFDAAPADGAAIRIYRDTQVDTIENIFYPGSAVRAKDLNDNFLQSLYVIQEGDFNADDANDKSSEAVQTANEAKTIAEDANTKSDAAQVAAEAAQEAAEKANAVEIALTPVYNTDGDPDSGIKYLENQYPQELGKGLVLPDQDNSYDVDGSLRYNSSTEKIEKYVTDSWVTAAGGAEVSASPPTPAVAGDVWWDPDTGRGYVYYTDTDSSQWVEMNPSWNGGIANDSVSTSKIADGAVSTAKLADGSVTPVKLDRAYVESIPADLTVDTLTSNGLVSAPVIESTGDIQTTSLNSGPLAGFRNQLINGDFRVWQRGTTGLTDAATFYGADRWVSGANNTISRSGTAPVGFAYSARIQYGGTATEGYVGQPIELDNTDKQAPVRAGTYTLSWYSNDNTTNAIARWRVSGTSTTGQINAPAFSAATEIEAADANGFARYACQITIPVTALTGGITSLYVAVRSSSNDFRVAGTQFEPGPVATPFEHRPIGTELALCQRYYQVLRPSSPSITALAFAGQKGFSVLYSFLVEMRAIPTLSNIEEPSVMTPGGAQTTLAAPLGNLQSRKDFWVIVFGKNGLTDGTYAVNTYGSARFDAEL